jgi:hypothetical protein
MFFGIYRAHSVKLVLHFTGAWWTLSVIWTSISDFLYCLIIHHGSFRALKHICYREVAGGFVKTVPKWRDSPLRSARHYTSSFKRSMFPCRLYVSRSVLVWASQSTSSLYLQSDGPTSCFGHKIRILILGKLFIRRISFVPIKICNCMQIYLKITYFRMWNRDFFSSFELCFGSHCFKTRSG